VLPLVVLSANTQPPPPTPPPGGEDGLGCRQPTRAPTDNCNIQVGGRQGGGGPGGAPCMLGAAEQKMGGWRRQAASGRCRRGGCRSGGFSGGFSGPHTLLWRMCDCRGAPITAARPSGSGTLDSLACVGAIGACRGFTGFGSYCKRDRQHRRPWRATCMPCRRLAEVSGQQPARRMQPPRRHHKHHKLSSLCQVTGAAPYG